MYQRPFSWMVTSPVTLSRIAIMCGVSRSAGTPHDKHLRCCWEHNLLMCPHQNSSLLLSIVQNSLSSTLIACPSLDLFLNVTFHQRTSQNLKYTYDSIFSEPTSNKAESGQEANCTVWHFFWRGFIIIHAARILTFVDNKVLCLFLLNRRTYFLKRRTWSSWTKRIRDRWVTSIDGA